MPKLRNTRERFRFSCCVLYWYYVDSLQKWVNAFMHSCTQRWERLAQHFLTTSLGPVVQSECRPAPAPTLAKAIQDRGAAVAEDRLCSKISRLPGSRLCDTSQNSAVDVSGIANYLLPYTISNRVAPIVPQPPHSALIMQHGIVTPAGSAGAMTGMQEDQRPSPVLCGVEAAAEPPFAVGIVPALHTMKGLNRACAYPGSPSMQLRSTSHHVR